jgi:hypothetical protein
MAQMATLGTPMPADQAAVDLGQVQAQIVAAQRKQQLAQMLQERGYVPNSGAMGAIAMLASAFKGKKLDRKAGESLGEAMQRKFAEEARLKAVEADAEMRRDMAKEERAHGYRLDEKRAPGWEAPPTSVREYEYANQDPRFGNFLERDRASRGTHVTVNAGPQGPQSTKFQEALGGEQARKYVEWQQDAVTAAEAKQKIAALRHITELQRTGKVQEAQAIVGQYFGTQAGANLQAFNATTGPMVIDLASKLKPLSNSDIAFVKTTVPRFGNDPRANAQILNLLEQAADRQIKLYDDAAKYAEDPAHRSLDGFRPAYTPRSDAPAPAAAATRPRAKNAAGQVVEWNGTTWVIAK